MANNNAVHAQRPIVEPASGRRSVPNIPFAAQWSTAALASLSNWPWQWQRAARLDFDPGPGKRSGHGSLTVLPYVAKSLAGKVRPDDPAAGGS